MFLSCTIESAISCDPVAPAAFDHAVRKAVQRDIEDVPAGPLEPGGHAAELVVLLQQQHAAAGAAENVGRGQPGQAAADDDDVVFVFGVFEKIAGHEALDTQNGVSRQTRRKLRPGRRQAATGSNRSKCSKPPATIAVRLPMLRQNPHNVKWNQPL